MIDIGNIFLWNDKKAPYLYITFLATKKSECDEIVNEFKKTFNAEISDTIIYQTYSPERNNDEIVGEIILYLTNDGTPIDQKPELVEQIKNFKINGEKAFYYAQIQHPFDGSLDL